MQLKSLIVALAVGSMILVGCSAPKDGEHCLHILTSNDIHGAYFDSTYTRQDIKPSMLAMQYYVDSVRTAVGEDNVLLIDDGDFLQGDNASYYFNYVDTDEPHVFSRMAAYMGYDVIVAGNHDIETGHPGYDRIAAELKERGIPFLAGNARRNDSGKPYFPVSATFRRAGVKVCVLGFDNANIKAWLDESLWDGMHFESLLPLVQQEVDKVIRKKKPQVVVVAVHSGTGEGDGSILESQGLDLYNSLKGVDVLVCGHDHKAYVRSDGDKCLVNSGSHCRNLGHAVLTLGTQGGKVTSRSVQAGLIPVDASMADPDMSEAFHEDYLKVKTFTTREVGELTSDMVLSDFALGMSDYINFIHRVELESCPADISIVAPLTQRGTIHAGKLTYNDLFTLYQYENQLFLVSMSGEEVMNYLEVSYDQWIQTVSSPDDHVLNIINTPDPRTGRGKWSFREATFNFDSMAGIRYTVDVTKSIGQRVVIESMADGSPFDPAGTYKVAMTSYRASGGGGLMAKVGIDTDRIEERVIEKYPEIRELMYDYILEHGTVDPAEIADESVIGHWEFIPQDIAIPGIKADMELVF